MSSHSNWWGILTGQCAQTDQFVAAACAPDDDQQFKELDSFLVPHQPDRPMRCIIETNQVSKSIQYQGDEMMKREYIKRMDESEVLRRTESSRNEMHEDRAGRSSWDDDVLSTLAETLSIAITEARTEITTGTGATRFAANLDRYSRAKPKYNQVTRPPSFTVLDKIQTSRSLGSAASFDVMGLRERFSSRSASNDRGEARIQQKPRLGTPVIGLNDSMCVFLDPCVGERAEFILKDEYYNALHLQLHFHCIEFYRNSFLPMFPNSPIPKGFLRSRTSLSNGSCRSFLERPPQLIKSGSSSTNSSRSPRRGVDFGTSDVPSWPVKYLVDESAFMDLAIVGSLGLVDRGATSPSKLNKKAPEHYLVLMNRRSGVPLAVCALKSPYGEPVVRIYATKQRVFGQHPAASTSTLGLDWSDPYPLYAWAEFTAEGEFPLPVRYSMYMASGSDGRFETEPSYRASHKTVGCPDIMVVGRTETEKEFRGCALLSLQADTINDELHFASLSLSRGIDPVLLICFSAIVDETMERTMRLQCDVSRRRRSKALASAVDSKASKRGLR